MIKEVYVLSTSTPIGDSVVGVYKSKDIADKAAEEFLRLAEEAVGRKFTMGMEDNFDDAYDEFLEDKELFSGITKTLIEKFELK